MMDNAMAMVSSCMSRFISTRGTSSPAIRMTGWLPTLRCKSEAFRSDATFNKSLMCIFLSPFRAGWHGPSGTVPTIFAERPGVVDRQRQPDQGDDLSRRIKLERHWFFLVRIKTLTPFGKQEPWWSD